MPQKSHTLFVGRPDIVVKKETERLIEASRRLLKQTEDIAKGYKPTKREAPRDSEN
ncbi:MAG: hypothetical protein ACOZAM_22075 [Pseudomonadota bacterium]